jgi:hypothetical protein
MYEDLKIPYMFFFTSQNSPHITLCNEHCLKLLLGVCNTKTRGDLSLSLTPAKLGHRPSRAIFFIYVLSVRTSSLFIFYLSRLLLYRGKRKVAPHTVQHSH